MHPPKNAHVLVWLVPLFPPVGAAIRAVGGGETAINNGMITWPPKDDRLSGLVLECLLARKCCVRRMQ